MTLGDVQGKKIGIRKMFFFILGCLMGRIMRHNWVGKNKESILQSLNVRLHEYFEAWKH